MRKKMELRRVPNTQCVILAFQKEEEPLNIRNCSRAIHLLSTEIRLTLAMIMIVRKRW